jgi:hypothetical protein
MNVRRAALPLLVLALAWRSAPQLLELVRGAWQLQRLPFGARRARVNGPLPADVAKIKAAIPYDEPIALIGPGDNDWPAIFANYYGYPWRTRLYRDLDEYRLATGDPARPRHIATVSDAGARVATYPELRDVRLRAGGRVVREGALKPAPRTFFIPLAGSVDGPPPDSYVTEADFANDGASAVQVRMTLLPEQMVRMLTIAPRGRASFYDLVYESFGIMEVRAVRVEADGPLRAGIWYVNRGRGEAAALPFVTAPAGGAFRCPVMECKVWEVSLLPPYAIRSRRFAGDIRVETKSSFLFASTNERPTRFLWPEGVAP